MLIVADSFPLIVRVQIGHIDVLPKLFGQVIVPPEVLTELRESPRIIPGHVRSLGRGV
jgi:predicted nucleic acid-binding protein